MKDAKLTWLSTNYYIINLYHNHAKDYINKKIFKNDSKNGKVSFWEYSNNDDFTLSSYPQYFNRELLKRPYIVFKQEIYEREGKELYSVSLVVNQIYDNITLLSPPFKDDEFEPFLFSSIKEAKKLIQLDNQITDYTMYLTDRYTEKTLDIKNFNSLIELYEYCYGEGCSPLYRFVSSVNGFDLNYRIYSKDKKLLFNYGRVEKDCYIYDKLIEKYSKPYGSQSFGIDIKMRRYPDRPQREYKIIIPKSFDSISVVPTNYKVSLSDGYLYNIWDDAKTVFDFVKNKPLNKVVWPVDGEIDFKNNDGIYRTGDIVYFQKDLDKDKYKCGVVVWSGKDYVNPKLSVDGVLDISEFKQEINTRKKAISYLRDKGFTVFNLGKLLVVSEDEDCDMELEDVCSKMEEISKKLEKL